MKLTNLLPLVESFKTAQQVFSKSEDPAVVSSVLSRFKSLSSQNRLPADKRDITQWMKKPFKELADFVKSSETIPSNKKIKNADKRQSIKVAEFGDWVVIKPLTKEASCQYGAGTRWCTAATEAENHFDSISSVSTLIYFINKKTNAKFAASIDPKAAFDVDGDEDGNAQLDTGNSEFFDAEDDSIGLDDLCASLHIDDESLFTIFRGAVANKSHETLRAEKEAQEARKAEAEKARAERSLAHAKEYIDATMKAAGSIGKEDPEHILHEWGRRDSFSVPSTRYMETLGIDSTLIAEYVKAKQQVEKLKTAYNTYKTQMYEITNFAHTDRYQTNAENWLERGITSISQSGVLDVLGEKYRKAFEDMVGKAKANIQRNKDYLQSR